jgi:hypothetical protein
VRTCEGYSWITSIKSVLFCNMTVSTCADKCSLHVTKWTEVLTLMIVHVTTAFQVYSSTV